MAQAIASRYVGRQVFGYFEALGYIKPPRHGKGGGEVCGRNVSARGQHIMFLPRNPRAQG